MKVLFVISIAVAAIISNPAFANDSDARVYIKNGVAKVITAQPQTIPYCSSHPQSGLNLCTNNCGNLYQSVLRYCGSVGLSDQDRITCYEEAQLGVDQCDSDCAEQCTT